MSKKSLLYCIVSKARGHSYVGVTNDFERRLNQHNGLKAGGARYTRGGEWEPLFHVDGFQDRSHVLQLEWLLHKNRLRIPGHQRNPFGNSSGARRAWKLYWALQRERFTKKSPLTHKFRFTVHWFNPKFEAIAQTMYWDNISS